MLRLHTRHLILAFGPSGIGKSTAMRYARSVLSDVSFLQLDLLARDLGRERGIIDQNQGVGDILNRTGADQFLSLAIDAGNRLTEAHGDSSVVIDVGAGILDARKVGRWLRAHTSLVFTATPAVVYERIRDARQDPRTFKQYCAQEFSARRKRLYRRAQYQVDADCATPDELGERFVQRLRELLQRRSLRFL